ncbi:MAG: hypothetical protein AAB071_04060 [Bacteroidota bacterium]
MYKHTKLSELSIDEIINEAILREQNLRSFYEEAIHEVGQDTYHHLERLLLQQHTRIELLEQLRDDILCVREMTGEIAD